MGIRQKGYWLRQTEAIRRQNIASTARAIRIGMADEKGWRGAMDELELTQTAEESKKQLSESWWGLNKLSQQLARSRKGGKGV